MGDGNVCNGLDSDSAFNAFSENQGCILYEITN